ncbi:MFS transporter [Diaphorobacter sp. HDW4A]|uniref:MFS transporter n=1 Tax=Betaproteobacteria TaxID=28216 RepID=UPI00140D029B|nr:MULTISPECIES: MFS transporter [Betaproteobacteria]MCK6394962.1 MFS transporter [Zoogloea sp.]QIL78953.1 MFS transporter [Diaphorobacter sp. HDW4A]
MTEFATTTRLRTPAGTWWLLGSLYTTQFLALGFLSVALVALLQEQGASMSRVSLIYLLGTVWAFKLLWAPLLDHFGWTRLGHYRGWLLLTQAGLVLAPLAMMALDPVVDFPAVYALAVLVAVLSATQDVATDAIACRTLPETERGLGNGIQTAGGLLGNLLGGGVLVMAYPSIGWSACMGWLAAGTAVSLAQLAWLSEPGQRLTPLAARTLYGRLRTFWPDAGGIGWLFVLLLFPFASGLAYGLVTPLLVASGWGMERIGLVTNVAGSLLSAGSALAAGWLLPRWGRRRALVMAAAINLFGSAALLAPWAGWGGVGGSDAALTLAVCLYFLCYTPLHVVLATLMMDRVHPASAGTDYSLQFSVFMLSSMGSATLAPLLTDALGMRDTLLVGAVAALASVVLAWRPRLSTPPAPATAPTPARPS